MELPYSRFPLSVNGNVKESQPLAVLIGVFGFLEDVGLYFFRNRHLLLYIFGRWTRFES